MFEKKDYRRCYRMSDFRVMHAFPLTEEHIKAIDKVIDDMIYGYEYANDTFLIKSTIICYIESDPTGWYVRLQDFCSPSINFIRRMGDYREYQKEEYERKSTCLTEREQNFAEKYHGEVYKFLKYKKLDIDEYYDVVIMGYLKAVKDYCRKESARQYTFSAVATRAMLDCLYKYWRAEGAEKRKLNHIGISLDENISEDGKESNLYEIVADERNAISDFETCEMIKSVCNALSDKGIEIVKMLLNGYNKTEIQRNCNLKRKAYESEMQRIRDVVSEIYC